MANADAFGTRRLLERIQSLEIEDRMHLDQASTSELYGKVQETPQTGSCIGEDDIIRLENSYGRN